MYVFVRAYVGAYVCMKFSVIESHCSIMLRDPCNALRRMVISLSFCLCVVEYCFLLSRGDCAMKGCGGEYDKDIYTCTTSDELRAFWRVHSAEKWTGITIRAFILHLRALEPGRHSHRPRMGKQGLDDIAHWVQWS